MDIKPKYQLHPISDLILGMADIDYRYPPPRTPRTAQHESPRKSSTKSLPTPVMSRSPEARSSNRLRGVSSATSNLAGPQQDRWSGESLVERWQRPGFRRDDYVPVPRSPKRRKLSDPGRDVESALRLRTQREMGDAALLHFQNQLLEIFEAEDRRAPDTSNTVAEEVGDFFDQPDEEDEQQELRLSISALKRLQTSLKQLGSLNRLQDISSDHLRRLQRLCEPSIESAQILNLQPPRDASDDDDWTRWRGRIHKAEVGAASACTFAYTVLGSGHDETLLGLDTLRWLPNVLVNMFENCLIPVIEARPDGQSAGLYQVASTFKDELKSLLHAGRKLLDLVSMICVQVKGADSIVNATEFLAAKLIFVQNAYNDKGSALGLQAYEKVRMQAMECLATLYAAFPSERSAILDEILTSLDKLPSTSRSARQYKLGEGKNVQLISALFIQLVQTTSMANTTTTRTRKARAPTHLAGDADGSDLDDGVNGVQADEIADVKPPSDRIQDQLSRQADELYDEAARSAQEIVFYMVGKASKVTKSGDSPYRNVLDFFIDDLINVLPMADWPASELLLRLLAARMIDLAKNERAASTKNMALECLGTMGSAISALRASVRPLSSSMTRDSDSGLSPTAQHLLELSEDQMLTGLRNEDLIASDGPFAITNSYFRSRAGDNLHARSARCYYLAQYAKLVSLALRASSHEATESAMDSEASKAAATILHQLTEPDTGSADNEDRETVTGHEARLAYVLSILNLGFCRRFGVIVKTLAASFSSDQAQVRSRSLKSVVTMLESDPSLLDRDPTIADDVFRCASDDSAMVRDSALSVIAKFIISKPALEEKGIKRLLECVGDAKVGVQKRAMGHLKEIYLQDERASLKTAIARTVLIRTADHEETVADIANRTLADVWIVPSLALLANDTESAKAQVGIADLTEHIVQCITPDPDGLIPLLKAFLRWNLKNSAKNIQRLEKLYGDIVNVLFQATISDTASQPTLMALMAFAEARPQTVAPHQLSNLKRYLSNLTSREDLFMFKSVIGIFRCVLPQLSSTHNTLLRDIQNDLLKSILKLRRRSEMDEVMSCLNTIDGVLHNTVRLVKLTASVVSQLASSTLSSTARGRILLIAGSIGKYLDLEKSAPLFLNELKTFHGGSVAGLLADSVYPFTSKHQPTDIRTIALESLGSICQAWPGQFNKPHIREVFFLVLSDHPSASPATTPPTEQELSQMQVKVLKVFDQLYADRAATKGDVSKSEGKGEIQELKKLGGDSKTRDEDSAVAIITRTVLDHVLRIALSEEGEKAALAAQTLASISHQGMIHPKQSTGAFVALETSTDLRISKVATTAHQLLHQQHESVCEREYMYAVHEAFRYQQTVAHDPTGATHPGFKAKLAPCFAIINGSGTKYVKKFLSNLVSRLNFEFSKMEATVDRPSEHLLFVRFVVQNLAFFEYAKVDDLLHTILQLELAVGKNGAEIAQAIETQLGPGAETVPVDHGLPHVGQEQPAWELSMDPVVLTRLCTAACAITLVSETSSYLRRQYGISRDVKSAIQQSKQAKESAKAPLKVHGITGDRFWNASTSILTSLGSTEAMIARCKSFTALMAIDDDVRVAEEGEEMRAYSASVGPEEDYPPKGKKRKIVGTPVGGTPKKPRGRAPKHGTGRRSSSISSIDGPAGEDAGF